MGVCSDGSCGQGWAWPLCTGQGSTVLDHSRGHGPELHRVLAGAQSPGSEAVNSAQLQDLACLVWQSQTTLAGTICHVGSWSLQKYPKAQGNPMYCTGGWVANARAREAALIGKRFRNTDFQLPADPMSMFLSSPHTYLLLFYLKTNPVMLNLGQRQTDPNNKKSCYSNPTGRCNSTSEPDDKLSPCAMNPPIGTRHQWPSGSATTHVSRHHVSMFVHTQDLFPSPLHLDGGSLSDWESRGSELTMW